MNDDGRIETILADWRKRSAAGETLSVDDVIAANPDLADALRARLGAPAAPPEARDPALRSVPPRRYSEFRVLGQGGMGIVYWAIDTDLNRQVAFKVVRPDAGQSGAPTPPAPIELSPPAGGTPASQAFETLKARFLQEAWVTAGLEHPGIVPVYEVGRTEGGVPYYTMRFVRGSRTLAAAINSAKGKPIDERLALLEPFLRICDTIRYAHAHGVIHRDLKPDNVALGEFGEVVVLDWGLAKMIGRPDALAETWQHRLQEYRDAADLKTMAHALGTPGYMAPEAALGRIADVDAKSDVYSLGAMLFEVLVGRLPYEFRTYGEFARQLMNEDAPAATSIDASVPAELSAICANALTRGREERTPSVDALAADVRGWLAQRAADRELDALREQAKAAFAAASELQGDLRLHQLDRAASACDQVLAKRAEDATAVSLRREIDVMRARGVEERSAAARRTALRRVGVAAAVFLAVAGAAIGRVLYDQKQDAEQARSDMRLERDAKQAALEDEKAARATAVSSLARARLLGLLNASSASQDSQPMRSLLLAIEAAQLPGGEAAETRLRDAVRLSHERVLLRGHEAAVIGAKFSPDGARVVTASDDGTTRLWNTATGKQTAVLRGHEGAVVSAEFSPDGSRIVTASRDNTARLWDAATGTQTAVLRGNESALLPGHKAAVNSAAFSPDGSRVVTAADDGTARIWDAATGREAVVLRGHKFPVTGVALSPDGARVVTASLYEPAARLWNAATGKEITVLAGHSGGVCTVAFSPDGTRVVTAGDDGTARLWDAATGKVITVLRGHQDVVKSASFSPDGSRVITGSRDTTARLWDAATGKESAILRGHEGEVYRAAFSADGARVVTASFDRTVRLWDAATGKGTAVLCGHEGPVASAAFSPDGARVVTASYDKTARLWDTAPATETTVLRGHEGKVRNVAFSPDGARVVTASDDKTARLWDAATGKEISVLRGHNNLVVSAAFSPDSSRVVTASYDDTARLWDAATGKEVTVLRGHKDVVESAAFSRDGARVVTASRDGTARLWDAATGMETAVLRGSGGWVLSAALSPDGARVVTADANAARLWDVATGKETAVLRGHASLVESAAFSPDGTRIVTASLDKTARIWDAAVGTETVRLVGHEGEVLSAAFSADGARVVTASIDRTVRLWDAATGIETAVLRGHEGHVNCAAFSPDGVRVVTASHDKTARIWSARLADVLAAAKSAVSRDFTAEELASYGELLSDETKARARAALAAGK